MENINIKNTYNKNGILSTKEYLNDKGELHRDGDKPVYIIKCIEFLKSI